MINKHKKGFTLIETMVAVLILATAIAGPLTIASKGLQSSLIAKDQTTAYYLAQDAVEYIRFLRDSNRLAGNAWLAGLDGTANGHTTNSGGGTPGNCVSASGNSACLVDSLNDQVTSCSDSTCSASPLKYDPNTNGGYFNYTTGAATTFTRVVTVLFPVGSGGATEASVIVKVSWTDIGPTHSISVREELFNWQ